MATSIEPSAAPKANSASASVAGEFATAEPWQHHRQAEPARDDDRPAAIARAHDPGQQHRDDRADAEAEQQQSEHAVVDAEPRLRERHQRRPARDAEARDEKGEPRRKARRRPIGRRHGNSGRKQGRWDVRLAPRLPRLYVRGTAEPSGRLECQGRVRPCRGSVNPLLAKIFHFTEIRICRTCRPSRLDLEGRSYVVTNREPGCGGRGSVGARGAGRAGSPCEPVAARGRAALKGSSRQHFSGSVDTAGEPCGEMAGRAYGKTVWSWPSLLRSSFRGGVCEPNRADSIVNSRGEGGQKESSAPGRARHKPSNHRAGKAE